MDFRPVCGTVLGQVGPLPSPARVIGASRRSRYPGRPWPGPSMENTALQLLSNRRDLSTRSFRWRPHEDDRHLGSMRGRRSTRRDVDGGSQLHASRSGGEGRAVIPAGASTGGHEAVEWGTAATGTRARVSRERWRNARRAARRFHHRHGRVGRQGRSTTPSPRLGLRPGAGAPWVRTPSSHCRSQTLLARARDEFPTPRQHGACSRSEVHSATAHGECRVRRSSRGRLARHPGCAGVVPLRGIELRAGDRVGGECASPPPVLLGERGGPSSLVADEGGFGGRARRQ